MTTVLSCISESEEGSDDYLLSQQYNRFGATDNAFKTFVKNQLQELRSCVIIKSWKNYSKYLCIVDESIAVQNGVPQHAVCTIRDEVGKRFVYCHSVICKKGKHKKLKKYFDANSLCCHLHNVLSDASLNTTNMSLAYGGDVATDLGSDDDNTDIDSGKFEVCNG
jgi:hypothetical protein